MSTYLNTETNEYPLHSGDLALLGISIDSLPENIVPVLVEPPQVEFPFYFLEKSPVKNDDNDWIAIFEIKELTEEEKIYFKKQQVMQKVMTYQTLTQEEALLLTE